MEPDHKPSVISRLLDEVSWEGSNVKRYRDGGRGMENPLTAEVFVRGLSPDGFGNGVGFGPFQGCDDVSFIGECLLFGRGKVVVDVGGDGHG